MYFAQTRKHDVAEAFLTNALRMIPLVRPCFRSDLLKSLLSQCTQIPTLKSKHETLTNEYTKLVASAHRSLPALGARASDSRISNAASNAVVQGVGAGHGQGLQADLNAAPLPKAAPSTSAADGCDEK